MRRLSRITHPELFKEQCPCQKMRIIMKTDKSGCKSRNTRLTLPVTLCKCTLMSRLVFAGLVVGSPTLQLSIAGHSGDMAEKLCLHYASQASYTIIMQRIWLKYAKTNCFQAGRLLSPLNNTDTMSRKQEMHFAESVDKSLK